MMLPWGQLTALVCYPTKKITELRNYSIALDIEYTRTPKTKAGLLFTKLLTLTGVPNTIKDHLGFSVHLS